MLRRSAHSRWAHNPFGSIGDSMQIIRFSFLTIATLFLSACTSSAIPPTSTFELSSYPSPLSATNPNHISQIQAIESLQRQLNIPPSSIEFIETTTMINSPNGDMVVALYQDSQGRRYLVEPATNRVVEMNARSLIPSFPLTATALGLSMEDLRITAEQFIAATTDDFPALMLGLAYEEGTKGDFYFYNWRDERASASMNRPFAQIGIHKSGELIAYYNTLGFK
ncbi:MAG TPA: hypothetical protein VMX56_00050 [Anaerolineales bacterium]|nr:hypothetical protein [Anaerolineales bacterium]